MRPIEYPVKTYYLYTTDEECYEVFAMDLQDAYETLLENEPSLAVHDIKLVKEYACAKPHETIH